MLTELKLAFDIWFLLLSSSCACPYPGLASIVLGKLGLGLFACLRATLRLRYAEQAHQRAETMIRKPRMANTVAMVAWVFVSELAFLAAEEPDAAEVSESVSPEKAAGFTPACGDGAMVTSIWWCDNNPPTPLTVTCGGAGAGAGAQARARERGRPSPNLVQTRPSEL